MRSLTFVKRAYELKYLRYLLSKIPDLHSLDDELQGTVSRNETPLILQEETRKKRKDDKSQKKQSAIQDPDNDE